MAGAIVKGVIIGILAVILFGLVYYTIAFNSVGMADDKLAPRINKGDLVHYETVSINEVKVDDLVVYKTDSFLRISKVTTDAGAATSFDDLQITVTDAYGTDYKIKSYDVQKVDYVIPDGAFILKGVLGLPQGIWVFILVFVSPIIILKLRERSKK